MERKKVTKDIGQLAGRVLVFGGVYSNLQALQKMKAIAESLSIPPEHIPRFAALLAKAMQAQGQALSALGERRLAALAPGSGGAPSGEAVQASGDGCIELSFELPGHGRVRVVCGQQGRRDVWHNLWVGSTRYGFNGRRWARHQVPPAAVLEAVAERGITVFKGGR